MKRVQKMNERKISIACLLAVFLLPIAPAFAQQTLTLEECRAMALEHNKKIRMAQEDAQIALSSALFRDTQITPLLIN